MVQRLHDLGDEPSQALLRHPLRQRRREQKQLVLIVGKKVVARPDRLAGETETTSTAPVQFDPSRDCSIQSPRSRRFLGNVSEETFRLLDLRRGRLELEAHPRREGLSDSLKGVDRFGLHKKGYEEPLASSPPSSSISAAASTSPIDSA